MKGISEMIAKATNYLICQQLLSKLLAQETLSYAPPLFNPMTLYDGSRNKEAKLLLIEIETLFI